MPGPDPGIHEARTPAPTRHPRQTLHARSGEEALEVLAQDGQAGRVDLLFTDLVMPRGMNGLVLAERARRLYPHLRILLTAGYTEELVAQGPPTLGLDVLGKPYRRAELADRVRTALDRPVTGPRPAVPPEGRPKEG